MGPEGTLPRCLCAGPAAAAAPRPGPGGSFPTRNIQLHYHCGRSEEKRYRSAPRGSEPRASPTASPGHSAGWHYLPTVASIGKHQFLSSNLLRSLIEIPPCRQPIFRLLSAEQGALLVISPLRSGTGWGFFSALTRNQKTKPNQTELIPVAIPAPTGTSRILLVVVAKRQRGPALPVPGRS